MKTISKYQKSDTLRPFYAILTAIKFRYLSVKGVNTLHKTNLNTNNMTTRKTIGAYLPGNSTVELRPVSLPSPGHGQVILKTKASTICGSDIRAIYREHLGKGPEAYQNKVAGHEPCGQIIECGPGMRRFKTGDRVIVYHISGCGVCNDCRRGYMISCTSPLRAAYGWQRDGGMCEYILADEKDLVQLPDELTYTDGAQVACGFGTVYEGLEKIGISGNDQVLVTGLGPVGLAACMLAKAMGAERVVGTDLNADRCQMALEKGLADEVFISGPESLAQALKASRGLGYEKTVDCSGNTHARQLAIRATRKWGKIVFIGEGGTCEFNPSPDIIHEQKTIYGSWVTSIWKMEELVERIVRWGIHPDELITHRFPLAQVDQAYALMDSGNCGKVAVVFDEEIAPSKLPYKTLNTGAKMPALGLGTFGSDHYDNATIAKGVKEALRMGYRHIDCAAVYGNEKEIGQAIKEAIAEGIVTREELWITSKVWNDKHEHVSEACQQSLEDLQLDYLDLYLVHWPFPNYHAKGVSVEARDPNARPYNHASFMRCWKSMEQLVAQGYVKNIGTSNMSIAKMKLLLRDCHIKPACTEMELHPHFQQPDVFQFMQAQGIQPIGFCPLGSPNRPERDKTATDTSPLEDPVICQIAAAHGVHPAIICLKWAVQNGQIPIPFTVKPAKLYSNLKSVTEDELTVAEMKALKAVDKNCRLIKGQVFTWEGATWQDLWDEKGTIKGA